MAYKCKRCGKFVAKDATVCKHCGLENPAEEVLACNTPKNYAEPSKQKNDIKYVICPACRTSLTLHPSLFNAEYLTCNICSKVFKNPYYQTPVRKFSKKWLIFNLCVGIITCLSLPKCNDAMKSDMLIENKVYIVKENSIGTYNKDDAEKFHQACVDHDKRTFYEMLYDGSAKTILAGTRVTFVGYVKGYACVQPETEPFTVLIPESKLIKEQ